MIFIFNNNSSRQIINIDQLDSKDSADQKQQQVIISGFQEIPLYKSPTTYNERLCSKEDRTWKERQFNQIKLDEVNSSQRNYASSWLRKVAASMHFGTDTYALSVDLLDRFLATLKVRPKFLECLAVGCLYIAAKCKEEDDTISITPEFVIDCNASCSANELLRMERLILEKFEWFVDFVTPVDFLQTYFALLLVIIGSQQGEDNEKAIVEKYIDLELKLAACLQQHRLTSFKPRILALALISVEFEKQQAHGSEINIDWLASISYLQQLAKVESDALLSCRDLIVRSLPSYKVVRLELSDLRFISHSYNQLKPLMNLSDRPTYADVVCGRTLPTLQ
ncbi:unnamed protein product [Rotaria socialis]|uniref:Cyclin-like domain-containing protein n=1 Tax=Rotaria socialis TaxID=392032 RepID=A0A818VNX3_9BILA|nr:unnamed protein product [Rotaria socialis]CAF3491492.1 unnamed protein product [Rotaria socialis]CAF3598371.1 unnamed protein product [Rotaria socialis]CAF3713296.1 unnamed protein product [Rotaria socialis]CAF3749526.1 unnamed protein product [Rotaria socialis]